MLYAYDRLHLGVVPALEQSLCYDILVQLAFCLCMDSNPSLLLWQVLWRERRQLVTHFWHRLVGTAGAWFFWCASPSAITAQAIKAELYKGCTCMLACPSAPSVHVTHQCVVATWTFKHGVNLEGTPAGVKDTGGHAAHVVTSALDPKEFNAGRCYLSACSRGLLVMLNAGARFHHRHFLT